MRNAEVTRHESVDVPAEDRVDSSVDGQHGKNVAHREIVGEIHRFHDIVPPTANSWIANTQAILQASMQAARLPIGPSKSRMRHEKHAVTLDN